MCAFPRYGNTSRRWVHGLNLSPCSMMTITEFPAGVAGWYLPRSAGIPLDVQGGWTVTINVVSAAGTFVEGGLFPVIGNDEASSETVPSFTSPVVTSPPTTLDPTGGASTTVAP